MIARDDCHDNHNSTADDGAENSAFPQHVSFFPIRSSNESSMRSSAQADVASTWGRTTSLGPNTAIVAYPVKRGKITKGKKALSRTL